MFFRSSLRCNKNMTWFRTPERFERQVSPECCYVFHVLEKEAQKSAHFMVLSSYLKKIKWNFGSFLGRNLPSYTFSGRISSELWSYLIHTYFSPITHFFTIDSANTSKKLRIVIHVPILILFLPPTIFVFNKMISTHFPNPYKVRS